MKYSIFDPPKKDYYEIYVKMRHGGEGVYVIVFTEFEEAQECAKKLGGRVVKVKVEGQE